ncbi:hypothetical protein BZA05DRAFT_167643 [Tricharina praecox]|uniref:uncharacterized protein n=1 Tax=Tricharina praecox TaxID=43433 RepID=UPI00221E57F0|nr:uncharacterized protein BZA05DRAFT_167643 [Tricharina praecox]KAI5857171.1 hypothetical protein BZA05DRAFT_167643 [Tricharina praecox]
MPTTLLLESLPLEVLHCVLSSLTASELVRVRSTSVRLRDLATANIHWRRCLLSDVVPVFAALSDVAAIPPRTWSFSLSHDGWFRAYRELQRVAQEPWLKRDEDLIGGPWMVYFKHHLEDRDLVGVEDPHALIEFTAERLAVWVSGIPLHNRRWWLQEDEEGVVKMRVTAYPPNEPGREPISLCRSLEHSTVLMVSDAPEFLDALVTLNDEILDEAARTGQITPTELATRQNAMLEAKQLVPSDYESRHQRLRLSLGLGREVLDDDDEPEDEVGSK